MNLEDMLVKEWLWIWQQDNWPDFIWDDRLLDAPLRAVYQLQGRLLGSIQIVAEDESLQSEMDALLQNAINTSAIEGEHLNAESVRSSLAKRLGLNHAGISASTPQTDGIVALLLDVTHKYDDVLTTERLYQWHRALFPAGQSGLIPIRVGDMRGKESMQVVSGPIGKQTVHFEAPPRQGLEHELDTFVRWFNNSKSDAAVDPLLRAGIAHLWFVTLHPFDDGNGRLARAIADLALAQAEHHSVRFYAMAAAIMANRKDYYRILEATQRGGLDISAWLEWFLAMLRQTMEHALEQVAHVLLKAKFWRQHAQTVLVDRQIKVINRLLDAGPEGFEGGINARKYAGLTKVSKATATRDLTDLVEKACLQKRPGGGRSTSYEIKWPPTINASGGMHDNCNK